LQIQHSMRYSKMRNAKYLKELLFFLFLIISVIASSQENKFIGKYTSLGYLEASNFKVFDNDSSYKDTTIMNYKSNGIFMDITEKYVLLFGDGLDNNFTYKISNDSLYIIENEKKTGLIAFKNEILEMHPSYSDSIQSSTFFFIKDSSDIQPKMDLKQIKKMLFNKTWALNLSSENQLNITFSKKGELSFITPEQTIFSEITWIEFANDFFMLFKNNTHENYMKIIEISNDNLTIEMPVNKLIERFYFTKN